MAVSLYQIYAKACTDLAKSIVIKSEATAAAMNRHDLNLRDSWIALGYPPYDVDPYDKRTWRYYLHLAGQYHATDTLMKVISADTGEEIPFTVDSLKQHRSTWRYYQKGSTYYRDLVNKYPKQRDLIDGIINPIDMDFAINARDHQILYYNDDLVESNEYSLMNRVQDYIDAYYLRWNNEDYALTDDLYIPARIGILYIYLPYVIMNFRYEVARTPEVHSFHLWSYLGSHQYLDTYKAHLNRFQALWLHRNIRWIEENAGKLKTFRELIDKILTNRGIPLAMFESSLDYTKMLEDEDTLYPDVIWKRHPLNLEDTLSKEGAVKSTDEIVEDQRRQARDNDDYIRSDTEHADFNFTRNRNKRSPTKVLESKLEDVTKRQAVRTEDVELNEWIHLTTNGLYDARISVHNPKTGEIMSLSQKDALILFVYCLHRANGIEPTLIPTITASNVLRLRKPTIEEVLKVVDTRYIDDLYVYAADHYTFPVERILSTEGFSEFCDKVIQLKNIHRNLYSFTTDAREHLQAKVIADQYYETVICKLTDRRMSFAAYFKAQGWKLEGLLVSEYTQLMAEITKVALGNDLVKRSSLKEIQEMMIRLLKQLCSYSVNFTNKITGEDIYVLDWGYQRYHSRGVQTLTEDYVQMTPLQAYNHTTRLYHKGEDALMGRFLDASNAIAEEFATERVDLILNLDNETIDRSFSAFRLPTVRVMKHHFGYGEYFANEPEKLTWWDDTQFRIHNTTEDKSSVVIDEETDNLIVRGVVYVKDDYKGGPKDREVFPEDFDSHSGDIINIDMENRYLEDGISPYLYETKGLPAIDGKGLEYFEEDDSNSPYHTDPNTEVVINVDNYIETVTNMIPLELGYSEINETIDLSPEHFIETVPKTIPDNYDDGVEDNSGIVITYPDNMYIEGESGNDDNVYVIDMGDDSEYVEEIPDGHKPTTANGPYVVNLNDSLVEDIPEGDQS